MQKEEQDMHSIYPQATSPICLEFMVTFFFLLMHFK